MDILIATNNLGKLKEFKAIFKDLPFKFYSLKDLNVTKEPIEYGLTLMENAIIKAKYYYELTKMPTLSDDTGLFIAGLNGDPGVNTARFSGEGDKGNREKVLNLLKNNNKRDAYFKTCLVFYDGLDLITSTGYLNGSISEKEVGDNGFGYDPIFYVDQYQKTLAELDSNTKNHLSHRYNASISMMMKLKLFYGLIEPLDIMKEYFDNIGEYELLQGGMSNSTYIVKNNHKKYIFRIPGLSSEIFVDRNIEFNALSTVSGDNSFRQMLSFDRVKGILIADYIEKEENTSPSEIIKTLKKLKEYSFDIDYLPFKRLEYYERLNKILGLEFDQKYYSYKEKLYKYQDKLNKRPLSFCHNDCQLSNFINDKLIDFEFCGNNDYLYDYACFGNNDLSISKEIIALDDDIIDKEEAFKIVNLWYSLQALSWYNVALFKDAIGFSLQQKMDFKQIALFFLNKAIDILEHF